MPLSFHRNARLAAIASMAAHQQGKFWEYHDVLFENQKALKKKDLIKYAQYLGLDMRKFKRALRDRDIAWKVDNDTRACNTVGRNSKNQRGKPLGGTPAFYINGIPLSGAHPFAEFQKVIADQLSKAKLMERQGVARKDIARALTAQSKNGGDYILRYFFDEIGLVGDAPPLARYRVPIEGEGRVFRGAPNAPLTLVHFTDLTKPSSKEMDGVIRTVESRYPGKIRVLKTPYVNLNDEGSILTFEALLAAGSQGKYWVMHDKLLENQGAHGRADLDRYASELELDTVKFANAMDQRLFKKEVLLGHRVARGVDVSSPEMIFINGARLEKADADDLAWLVEEELKVIKKEQALPGRTSDQMYANLTRRGRYASATEGRATSFNLEGAAMMGDPDAKIQIVEFASFQCPPCSVVGEPLKQLVKKYPKQVMVAFKHYPLPSQKESKMCSQAAIAAGKQGKFWEMHDRIFSLIQNRIPRDQKARVYPEKIQGFAQELGLDMARFNEDMNSSEIIKQVEADLAEGSAKGVRGTPSIFINGRKLNMRTARPGSLEPFLVADFGLNPTP